MGDHANSLARVWIVVLLFHRSTHNCSTSTPPQTQFLPAILACNTGRGHNHDIFPSQIPPHPSHWSMFGDSLRSLRTHSPTKSSRDSTPCSECSPPTSTSNSHNPITSPQQLDHRQELLEAAQARLRELQDAGDRQSMELDRLRLDNDHMKVLAQNSDEWVLVCS